LELSSFIEFLPGKPLPLKATAFKRGVVYNVI
jgi:hypothetical protein